MKKAYILLIPAFLTIGVGLGSAAYYTTEPEPQVLSATSEVEVSPIPSPVIEEPDIASPSPQISPSPKATVKPSLTPSPSPVLISKEEKQAICDAKKEEVRTMFEKILSVAREKRQEEIQRIKSEMKDPRCPNQHLKECEEIINNINRRISEVKLDGVDESTFLKEVRSATDDIHNQYCK